MPDDRQIPADAALVPARVWLRDDPDVTLVRPALTLTLYLDAPLEWASHHAEAVARRFTMRVASHELRWYTTSAIAHWRQLRSDELEGVLASFSAKTLLRRVRHLLKIRAVDDPGAPSLGIEYREVDPEKSAALPYLQVTMPQTTPSDELLALAIELGHTVPIAVAVGGFSFTWNTLFPKNSLGAIHRFLRRYHGMDVQQPEQMAWLARDAIPGPAWLTLVSDSAAQRMGLDLDALLARSWSPDVKVLPLARSTLIRAGARPQIGDTNLMHHPLEIAEVSRLLARHYPAEPPRLPGDVEREEDVSRAWMLRFVEPEGW